MRSGELTGLFIGESRPDFKNEYTSGEADFPAGCVFDWAEWRKEANHKKIVRKEENKSIMGDEGMWMFNEKW